jgi:hypothetical protein
MLKKLSRLLFLRVAVTLNPKKRKLKKHENNIRLLKKPNAEKGSNNVPARKRFGRRSNIYPNVRKRHQTAKRRELYKNMQGYKRLKIRHIRAI